MSDLPPKDSIDYKRYLILALSAGASLGLGLLSFGGMYALWPALIPAASGFVLSVLYEFEIYSQNLTRAFEKLISNDYFEKQLPRYYLNNYFQNNTTDKHPTFFAAYEQALRDNTLDRLTELEKLEAFKEAREDNNTDRLAQLKKLDQLDQLEALFDEQLNAPGKFEGSKLPRLVNKRKANVEELHTFLHRRPEDNTPSIHQEYMESVERRRWLMPLIKAFVLITTLSMSLGTTYLLVEVFSLVPWLAAMPAVLPIIIVPLSILGGAAYGLLTFNSVTNLMANDTLLTWVRKIRHNINDTGWSMPNISMAATTSLLFALALTLTICTAGTWWTIAHQIRPLFSWMRRLPPFIMSTINPIIMWLSAFSFNIENTSGTLHGLFSVKNAGDPEDNTPTLWEKFKLGVQKSIGHLREKENALQWVNPFRIILLPVLSLRYLLFAGHLLSIGVTADRIPKLSQYVSSFLGGLSEGFEDYDYFFGEDAHPTDLNSLLHARLSESQGHNHNKDLPTWLVEQIAEPLYAASSRWEIYFSSTIDSAKKEDPRILRDVLHRQKKDFFPNPCRDPLSYVEFTAVCSQPTKAKPNIRFFTAAPRQETSASPSSPDASQANSGH